jgi:hypothetical protein
MLHRLVPRTQLLQRLLFRFADEKDKDEEEEMSEASKKQSAVDQITMLRKRFSN